MCGIFGLVLPDGHSFPSERVASILRQLFLLSESRGKEAAGLAVVSGQSISILKRSQPASAMLRTTEYRSMLAGAVTCRDGMVLMGHSRLVTHGGRDSNANNQPVSGDGVVAIHNGIIINCAEIWHDILNRVPDTEVDTAALVALVGRSLSAGAGPQAATQSAFRALMGSASVALAFAEHDVVVLATNTGSLFTCRSPSGAVVFASEAYILAQVIKKAGVEPFFSEADIAQLRPGRGCVVALDHLATRDFSIEGAEATDAEPRSTPRTFLDMGGGAELSAPSVISPSLYKLTDESRRAMTAVWRRVYDSGLRRCSRCLTPETMPFITFDEAGVCNRCRAYKSPRLLGREALEERLAPHRRNDGRPDCVVGFSGGRDSTYGLHLAKTELGMNPVAFTFDWGMVTDLGRRNQARIVGKMGVEHIVVSADIERKRRYIRKNLEAWLSKPDLGMIPLLMAGDKQLLPLAIRTMRQLNVGLIIHSIGNSLEEGNHKIAFTGVTIDDAQPHLRLSILDKMRYLFYCGRQVLVNPGYLNESLWDSLSAYLSVFALPDDSLHLFRYLPWDEDQLLETITTEYGWETEPDTVATWRIDDGTAAFYNYIYLAIAGFTEFDTFRSAQIRAGVKGRGQAFDTVKNENLPRFDSLEWYAHTIGFDINRAIRIINAMPRLYR